MENLILENGCLTLVNENGEKSLVMTLGFVVGELYETANYHERRNRPGSAADCRARASRVMNTPQYREWLLGPGTIDD